MPAKKVCFVISDTGAVSQVSGVRRKKKSTTSRKRTTKKTTRKRRR